MTDTSEAALMTAGGNHADIASVSMNRKHIMACMERYRSYR
ncbi:MAG: hypothetical protein QE484_15135 [Rhizobium sp.]|nr:hypothetical protein [Rhizobium sp.]